MLTFIFFSNMHNHFTEYTGLIATTKLQHLTYFPAVINVSHALSFNKDPNLINGIFRSCVAYLATRQSRYSP